MKNTTVLPDGSAFFTASLPLPANHWLTAPAVPGWDSERDTAPDTPQPFLNHAEHQLTLDVLDAAMRRAREVGLATIVCADSDAQCRAIATMGPDMMICEPTANIGTGRMDAGDYISRTTRIVKDVDPTILVIQAAGVTSGEDVARALAQGADSSGGTSGIVQNPDWRAVLTQMFTAIAEHKKNRAQEEQMRPRTASRVNG